MPGSRILDIRELHKSFPGVRALQAVDFDLYEGEIHCLVGENGAGKSTLVEILSGNYHPDSGVISVGQESFRELSPARSLALGIDTVHQEDQLTLSVSAAENIYMGNLPRTAVGLFDRRKCIAESQRLVDSLGLSLDVSRLVSGLSAVERKAVCIAKALSGETRVLILDEPTSTLGREETAMLLSVVRNIRDKGIGIIYISHFINEIFDIADRITVFKDGRKVVTFPVAECTKEQVISAMVGRTTGHIFVRPAHRLGEVVFEVRGLTRRGVLEEVSFQVRQGEIFGLGGLVGSGRTELARLLFGLDRRDSGSIFLRGKEVAAASPLNAIRQGFGFLTEDRKETGLITRRPVKDNITIAELNVRRPLLLNLPAERRKAQQMVSALRIVTPSIEQIVVNLSGGNQQKVVLARWMLSDVDVLIFDEPTIGIDVGAKKEIYELMHAMAERGKIILMISSDLPELIALSDRIGVMRKGRLVKIVEREEFSEAALLKYATGVTDGGQK
jgi:ABC-type sugar transport system ATPase subunit